MAEKKKYRRAKKNALLLPHVAENAGEGLEQRTLSEEAQRAYNSVDELIRDLFGKSTSKTVTLSEEKMPDEPEEQELSDGIVEESAPAQIEEPDVPVTRTEPNTYVEVSDLEESALLTFEPESEPPLSLKEQMESSNEDFRLLLDMEYEKELGDAIGFERIRAYHERNINGRKSVRRRGERADLEFETQSQEIHIRRRYAKQHSQWILRLVLSVLAFVVLMLYENGKWMAEVFGGPLNGAQYPIPYILIGIQILLLDAALCYRPLWEGLRCILRFSPVDHSAHVGVLLVTLLYHVALLFTTHTEYPTLFLSPAAFCLVVLVAIELLNSYREAYAFEVVSARRQKYAMLPRVSVGSVQGGARARLYEESGKGNVWYLRPIGFVRNYFENTSHHVSRHRNLGTHFLLILGFGATMGLIAFAGGAAKARVYGFLLLTVLLCAPVISAVLTAIPLFFSAAFCLKKSGAIIGESPLEKGYAGDTLVLPDNEFFLSMDREHFRLLDLCDAHRVTVLLRALLEKIQSPLATSFGVDSDSRLSTAEVTLTHIGDEGVSADLVHQACKITLGTAEYMEKRGLVFTPVAQDAGRPLYVAVDNRVCALFYVRYTLSTNIESLLRDLQGCGIKIAVRSKDPCVREDVFAQLFATRLSRITVQKPSVNELDLRTERVDATVVALNSCKQLVHTMIVCCRVSRVGMWGKLLQLFSVLGGAALAVLLTILNILLPGVWVTLWIFFWCGIYTVLSYFYLRRPTDDI